MPVVQGTWALDAEGSIAYYSEVEDEEYHTTDIGVPNTETGIRSMSMGGHTESCMYI